MTDELDEHGNLKPPVSFYTNPKDQIKQILVEYLTDTGSGFAVTEQGDQVFLNERIVSRMDVQPGDVFDAHVLLNYADKRDKIKYRAMRVVAPDVIAPIFQDT
tara:strand:+ start:1372 stop:1680 length:309 start_codon:yes stop_codon:yes gene_type:complete